MPPVLDAPWKAAIRERILKNLDARLASAHEAYQRTIAKDATGADSATMERLYVLQHQHNARVLQLETDADEQIAREIRREEDARGWPSSAASSPPRDSLLATGADPTQALVEGRLAMLTLKTTIPAGGGAEYEFPPGAEYPDRDSPSSSGSSPDIQLHTQNYAASATGATVGGYSGYTSTEATSPALSITSSPEPYSPRTLSTSNSMFAAFDALEVSGMPVPQGGRAPPPAMSMSNAEYNAYHAAETHKALVREARLRKEKQLAQQAQFKARADEIHKRKYGTGATHRKGTPGAISTSSSMTSSIASIITISTDASTLSSAATSAAPSALTSPIDDRPPSAAFELDPGAVYRAEHPLPVEDVEALLTYHDQQWTYMLTMPSAGWLDFPWPILSFSSPQRVEELTLEAVAEYIFKPLNMGVNLIPMGSLQVASSGGVSASGKPIQGGTRTTRATTTVDKVPVSERERKFRVKARLSELRRRWEPVRFEAKYLSRVKGKEERDMVKDGAAVVSRILGDLGKRWEGIADV